MNYPIHTAQRHLNHAGEASERADAAAAGGSVSLTAELLARAACEMPAHDCGRPRLRAYMWCATLLLCRPKARSPMETFWVVIVSSRLVVSITLPQTGSYF